MWMKGRIQESFLSLTLHFFFFFFLTVSLIPQRVLHWSWWNSQVYLDDWNIWASRIWRGLQLKLKIVISPHNEDHNSTSVSPFLRSPPLRIKLSSQNLAHIHPLNVYGLAQCSFFCIVWRGFTDWFISIYREKKTKQKKMLFLGFKWSILQASKYKRIINQTRSDYGFVFFPCCLENKLWISCMLESLLMKSLAVVSLADYSVEWTEEKSITTT